MTHSGSGNKLGTWHRPLALVLVNALLLLAAAALVLLALARTQTASEIRSDQRLQEFAHDARELSALRLFLQEFEYLPGMFAIAEHRQDARQTEIDLRLLDLLSAAPEGRLGNELERLKGAYTRYTESVARIRGLEGAMEARAEAIDAGMDRLERFIEPGRPDASSPAVEDSAQALTNAIRADWRFVRQRLPQWMTIGLTNGVKQHRTSFALLFARSDQIRERLLLLRRFDDATGEIDRLDRAVLGYHERMVQLESATRLLVEYFEQLRSAVSAVNGALDRLSEDALSAATQNRATQGATDLQVAEPALIVAGLLAMLPLLLTLLFLRRNLSAPLGRIMASIDTAGVAPDPGADDWERLRLAIAGLYSRLSAQEAANQGSGERYKLLIENQGDMIVRLDPEGRFEFVSSTYCKTFGKSLEDLVGRAAPITLLAKGRGEQGGTMMDLYRPPYECVLEQRSETTRGWRWISWNHKALRSRSGKVEAIVSVGRDVTDRKLAELELEGQRHFLHTVIDAVADPIMVIRRDYRLQMFNEAARRSYGLNDDGNNEKLLGFCHKLMYGEDQPCEHVSRPCALHQVLQTGRPTTVLHLHETANGERTFELTASPYCDREGEVLGVVQVSRDITEKLKAEDKIRFLAHHDALTGLPNRVLLRDRFHQAAQQADREGHSIALLFLDLDHFKHVNDTLGHKVGDKLLQQVVMRLSSAVRGSDTVSRLGGDEFVVVLPLRGEVDAAERISAHILEIVSDPFQIDGHELRLSASIGISRYPQDGAVFEDLLKNADSAMYVAKEAGRNGCRYYELEMDKGGASRLKMLNAMQRALEKEDFNLLYQPQVELRGGRLVGFEALVNWQSRALGRLRPGQFVTLAEESGLIVPLGNWVLRQACGQVARWNRDTGRELPVAVNLSALQIRQESFVDLVVDALAESGLPARLLELELTESILLQDTDKVLVAVKALQELGIKLTMDDFGTGYSSLSYLKKFNLTGLKIDRSFVSDLPSEGDDATIVRAIIQMGQGLGLTVVAEGVETLEQVAWLEREGCERAQGYYFYKPMDAEGIARVLLHPEHCAQEAL